MGSVLMCRSIDYWMANVFDFRLDWGSQTRIYLSFLRAQLAIPKAIFIQSWIEQCRLIDNVLYIVLMGVVNFVLACDGFVWRTVYGCECMVNFNHMVITFRRECTTL